MSVPNDSTSDLPVRRTFLVECYLPSLDREEVSASAARVETAAKAIRDDTGRHLAYLGATLVAQDEVVFHTFSADDAAVVDAACRQAAIPFTRIVESEAMPTRRREA